jgi:hypothetical protein
VALWKAESGEALEEISGVIHDAYFDADAVEYEASAQTLRVPFAQGWDGLLLDKEPEWQQAPQPEVLRRTWRYTEERVPFMRGVIYVRHVESFVADAGAGDAGMLLGIDYDADTRKLRIGGVSGDLVALVGRIDVTAELRSDEFALYVSRRCGRLGVSERPLWGRSPEA